MGVSWVFTPPHSLHRGLSPKMKTVEALHSDSLLARWRSEIPLVFLLKIKPCGLFGDDFRMPNMSQFQENNPNESKLYWFLLSRRGILLGSYCNIIQRWVQQKCNRSTRMPILYKVGEPASLRSTIHRCPHAKTFDIHAYIHTYIHACIHTYIHACMHTK